MRALSSNRPIAILLSCLLCLLLTQAYGGRAALAAQTPDNDLRRSPIVRAVEKVAPAVVNITAARQEQRSMNPFADFFGQEMQPFFGQMFPETQRTVIATSLGSGVIIDGKAGLILTNAHVVAEATDVTVRLQDGREFAVELVGADPDFDLAVLRVNRKELKGQALPQTAMGDSSSILIGETVIAIGNPFGFTHTVTTGVISAVNRTVRTDEVAFTDFIQTDAAINPGNSGGPLLNILGELIGVNTAIQAQAQGIGFAIPINKARRVVDELVASGRVAHIWLGLDGQDLDQASASYFGLARCAGMLVTLVRPGTPAARAGLKPGDVLQTVDGLAVQDKDHYLDILRNYTVNQPMTLGVQRDGKFLKVEARGARFDAATAQRLAVERWGLSIDERSSRGAAAVSSVNPNSPAGKLGLRSGDAILQIGAYHMANADDFINAFSRYRLKNMVLMKVARGGRAYIVRLRI
ncbi:trypsin-like peptidase domain-containing protein [Desulfocurvibacter africanus]|uniref:HtrA2 peptidase n=2 Tax=Desulfocurvibacter africanus TaxID=873 RepID=F3YWA1_DESAF|nr:trypsin-like peptidase domain-containing protein [Desulfocurvibacter africanus]EGJ49204.1 HtrA2 peptidase [Desulfocurvibacter africanus subsp. africanus str. Walvis Bay]